jgi:hypothetical protein
MAGSCSSSALNGCLNCGPGLALFSVSASANVPTPPACPEYLNESYSGSKSYNGSTTYACNPPFAFGPCSYVGSYNASTSASTVTTVTESEGLTTITTIYSFTSSTQGSTNDTCANRNPVPDSIFDCTNTESSTSITKIDSCGNSTSSYSSTYNPCLEGGFVVDWVGGCYNTDGSTCETNTTCDKVTVKSTKGPGTTFCKSYGMGIMQSQRVKTNEKEYDKPESIVDKQISKLKTNNLPAGCNCGEGKDACWGAFSSFTIANPTVTISKAALKIGVIKEGFNKEYKSVGGTVKFYIPSSEDVEEDRTPCCSDDFSGTVVKEVGYSLGGSDFKEGAFLATDIGELSNTSGPVGGIVVACITIDDVSFI